MKKYMIRCDMEGVTGVVSYEQSRPGSPEYPFAQKMLMADLMASVNGLLDGGVNRVVIYDEHHRGRNIDLATLPSTVHVICGKPPYRPDWPGGLDGSFAGVMLLGLHSKWGTPGGLLAHTYEPDICDIRLNGMSIGEIGVEAAVAGDLGVPVLMVTGDSAGVAEAEALLPGVKGVVVKEALGEASGLCYATEATSQAIYTGAKEVATAPPPVAPYGPQGDATNITLEIEFNPGPYLAAVQQELAAEMPTDNVLRLRAPTTTEAYADYWQKKLHCKAVAAAQEA